MKSISDVLQSTNEATMLLEALSGTFFLLNPTNYRIIRLSPGYRELFGYNDQEIEEEITALDLLTPREAAEKSIADVLSKKHTQFEANVITKSGNVIPHILRAAVVELGGKQYIVGTAFNISSQVEAHEKLREQQLELAHISRVAAMSELLASIPHEINQPLAAITNNSRAGQRLLQAGLDSRDEIQEILEDISRDAMRAGEIIKHLRSLLKKEQGDFAIFDINECVTKVVELLRSTVYKVEPAIVTDLADRSLSIHGVEIQIQQVLMNLIMNAGDAISNQNGKPHEIRVCSKIRDDNHVVVSVFDNGPHLSDQIMKQAFDPFFSTKSSGLGMGLAISRTIIETHQGSINAHNCDGCGVEFAFSLPLAGKVN